jgi:hypothetical protein
MIPVDDPMSNNLRLEVFLRWAFNIDIVFPALGILPFDSNIDEVALLISE